nr:RNA-directed DNA polymerase, eukaryota [Tanacetum cinerariifolium]
MGICIPHEDVLLATESIGCSIFTMPFNFLGVKVGDIMSRRNSWEETIGKLSSRLSKWKLKALSIGGRLTLIKFVLSSIPLYHIQGVIIDWLEVYFGFQEKWRAWCLKFFAHNRALLFKWIWRFISHDSSLWARFIKAIYDTKGALDIFIRLPARCFPWLNILHEFRRLSHKRLELEEHVTVTSKLRDMSLMSSFRRDHRDGIKEDQFRLLRTSVAHILLSQVNDRWVWNLESSVCEVSLLNDVIAFDGGFVFVWLLRLLLLLGILEGWQSARTARLSNLHSHT